MRTTEAFPNALKRMGSYRLYKCRQGSGKEIKMQDKMCFVELNEECLMNIQNIRAIVRHGDGKGYDIYPYGEAALPTLEVIPRSKNPPYNSSVTTCTVAFNKLKDALKESGGDYMFIGKSVVLSNSHKPSYIRADIKESKIYITYDDCICVKIDFKSPQQTRNAYKLILHGLTGKRGDKE